MVLLEMYETAMTPFQRIMDNNTRLLGNAHCISASRWHCVLKYNIYNS